MTALAAQAFAFPAQREPALLRSFTLAFVVHAALIGVMFLGVRVQSRAPETVEVELVEAAPPPAPAPEPRVEPPQPAPPPKVEPAPPPPPPAAKPDIAQLEKAKPKPKPKPAAKPEPKRDKAFERQLQAQLAAEQKAVVEQQAATEAKRQEREFQAMLARKQKAERDRALAAWTDRIQAKIKSKIPVSAAEAVPGNPEAVFSVSLLPTGEVLTSTVRMTKSSGNKAYDDAVERAIVAASPLPKPDDPGVFQRQLELRFRPKDKPAS
jgi:colicin import membrane protein